ncbi:hypothetical protein MKX03_003835 [Papaver bracteatum]|nr:hypothetical protein MKX03_003835 [Papaver bracteatum]
MLTVCTDIVTGGNNKRLKVNGPVRMPTETLRYFSGTNTWDCFELRVHKGVIDLVNLSEVVKQSTREL